MMSLVRRFPALPVFGICALVFALGPALAARMQDAPDKTDKTVFVSVLDRSGKPVTDLKAEHFVVAEDNVQRTVKSAKISTQPFFIELLADTSKSAGATGMGTAGQSNIIQDVRVAFNAFVADVYEANPANQIALMEFGQASITIVKFTSKADDMKKGINKLFPKPSAASVLAEAIIQAGNDLQKVASPRRIIMILNVEPGYEESKENPTAINDSLRKSGASLWAVSLQQGTAKNPMHDIILLKLAENTGGRREIIVGQSAMVDNLKMYWAQLNSQYEVTYTRPSGTPVQVRVGIRAEGLKIYHNLYAPK